MLKCRITCVVLAVLCLIGLGITLYVPKEPNTAAACFFAYTCIAALAGNAVLSVMELNKAKKELQKKIEEERMAAESARRHGKKGKG